MKVSHEQKTDKTSMLLLMTDLYGVPITYIYIALPSSIIQHSLLFLRR